MSNLKPGKRETISELKRRVIEILVSAPFGITFATLFWYSNLSKGLQLFLTVICWGTLIVIIDLIAAAILKIIKNRNVKNPKADPFADDVFFKENMEKKHSIVIVDNKKNKKDTKIIKENNCKNKSSKNKSSKNTSNKSKEIKDIKRRK